MKINDSKGSSENLNVDSNDEQDNDNQVNKRDDKDNDKEQDNASEALRFGTLFFSFFRITSDSKHLRLHFRFIR